jgi:nucleotide-binding universal stress UspA family protein
MSIAKIIAPVTGSKRDSIVLGTALAAAKPFNAHVIALFVRPDPWMVVPYSGVPLSASLTQGLIDEANAIADQASKRARLTLYREAENAGARVLATPERVSELSCSFREAHGSLPHLVAEAARLSDLVVFGPQSEIDGDGINDAFLETLTKTDRPVLIAEQTPSRMVCNVAIAWDGSVAACHAVTAALPYLKHAEVIDILTVHKSGEPRHSTHELSEYLALHGLSCTEHFIRSEKGLVARELIEHALQRNTDLLVMGGYGHGYFREYLFGGVTQDIRWHASVPVVMMH